MECMNGGGVGDRAWEGGGAVSGAPSMLCLSWMYQRPTSSENGLFPRTLLKRPSIRVLFPFCWTQLSVSAIMHCVKRVGTHQP